MCVNLMNKETWQNQERSNRNKCKENQQGTCVIFPNYTAHNHIILTPKIEVNFREEKLGTVGIRILLVLRLLSCEVIMGAGPSKLVKYRYYFYLHQLKLKKLDGKVQLQ